MGMNISFGQSGKSQVREARLKCEKASMLIAEIVWGNGLRLANESQTGRFVSEP